MKRYGKVVHQVEAAWEILYHTVYNCTDGIADNNTDFIVKFPDWDPSLDSGSNISKQNQMHALHTLQKPRRFFFKENSDVPLANLWYSTQELIKDLKPFLDAGNDLAGSITIWRAILNDMRLMFHDRYDLVDITRQVLSKLANLVYGDAVIAFRRKDATALNLHSQKFLQLIKDIDVLLASDDNFLLGTWL